MIYFFAVTKKANVIVGTMEEYEILKQINKKFTEKRYNKLILELTLLYTDIYKVKCVNSKETYADTMYDIVDLT